jgi:Cu+-exporting ATPase
MNTVESFSKEEKIACTADCKKVCCKNKTEGEKVACAKECKKACCAKEAKA